MRRDQSFMPTGKNMKQVTDTVFCLVVLCSALVSSGERIAEKCGAVLTPRYINSMVLVNIGTCI